VCGGATAARERYDVRVGIRDIQRYALLAILTFGPLLWYGAQAINSRGNRVFLTGIGLAALSTAPLYVMSEDWGRWLHMTAMLVFVTILACKDINVHLPVRRPALAVPFVAAMAIIAFSWQLPHWIHAPIPVVRPWAQHALVQVPAYVFHAGTR